MRLEELQKREDVFAIAATTLSHGWQEQFGRDCAVSVGKTSPAEGVAFVSVPWTGVLCTHSANESVRVFIRDSFRYTPVRRRAHLQWLLGTFLASRVGLALTGRTGVSVEAPPFDARAIAIMPGNRRIRVFDFSRGLCRVFLKTGFEISSMEREISVRLSGKGPWIPLVDHSAKKGWFEEPIFIGTAVPRCPSNLSRDDAIRRAQALLDEWQSGEMRKASAFDYFRGVFEQVLLHLEHLSRRFEGDFNVVKVLADKALSLASRLENVEIGPTHGDFQAGNVMVSQSGEVRIVDWESAGTRLRVYDRLVLGLASRSPRGLGQRMAEFVDRGRLRGWKAEAGSEWRRALIAGFVLEDLLWFISDSLAAPLTQPSQGLVGLLNELPAIVSVLRHE